MVGILFEIESLGQHSPSYVLLIRKYSDSLLTDLRQHKYVTFIENHAMNPPDAPRLTSQLLSRKQTALKVGKKVTKILFQSHF